MCYKAEVRRPVVFSLLKKKHQSWKIPQFSIFILPEREMSPEKVK